MRYVVMLIALFIFRKNSGIIVVAIIATVINDAGEDEGKRINTGVRISSAARNDDCISKI